MLAQRESAAGRNPTIRSAPAFTPGQHDPIRRGTPNAFLLPRWTRRRTRTRSARSTTGSAPCRSRSCGSQARRSAARSCRPRSSGAGGPGTDPGRRAGALRRAVPRHAEPLVAAHEVSSGSLSASLVAPREVFGPALRLLGVASVILVHNHPSGDATPSREGLRLTRQLVRLGEAARDPGP